MAKTDIGTKEGLATELFTSADVARKLEAFIDHIKAVLLAIKHGGLLDATPPDSLDWEKHSAATELLANLGDDLQRLADLPGTDLSISLHVLATDVANGHFIGEMRA